MNLEGPKSETEIAKQVIGLSTGAVAFTVTFLEKFKSAGKDEALHMPPGLYVAWVLFGAAIAFALWYLMALTGNISAIAGKENGWTLKASDELSAAGDSGNTVIPGYAMMATFFLGVASLIWVGFSLA
jgi:hypothetical protein